MKRTKTLTFICFFVCLAVMSQATFAKEFPAELRVVAKCGLADNLYADYDEALSARLEMQKFDLAEIKSNAAKIKSDLVAIKSNNAEIQHLCSEALTAVSDAITRLETIDYLRRKIELPYRDVYGMLVTAERIENAKKAAIASELNGLVPTLKKLEITQRLLPRVAKPYAATETKSKNGDRIYVEVHEYPCFGDTLHIRNTGNELRDCVLEVKITGEKGDVGTSVFFIEKFESGKELVRILANGTEFAGEMFQQQTVYSIKKAELTLLSPEYSTSVEDEYGQKERDDDYATMFKDVKLTARYTEVTGGFFENWQRSATIYMDGFSRLPPCTLSVTFDGEGKTYSESDSGWSDGNGWTIYGNNKSGDKCKSYSAEVTFPRTNFKIKGTWTVGK